MVGVTDDFFPLAILAYFRSGASLIGSMGLVYFPPNVQAVEATATELGLHFARRPAEMLGMAGRNTPNFVSPYYAEEVIGHPNHQLMIGSLGS